MRNQPYPCPTDYWRLDGRLWYLAATRQKPLGEAVGGLSVTGVYDDGWATLRDPRGRGPDESKYDAIAEEREVPVPELRERGELVWTAYPKDETVDRLKEHAEDLRNLARLAHGIGIVPGLEGERGVLVRDAADALEASAGAALKALATVEKTIRRDRWEKHEDARRALNDELGIANCDHLLPDPDCPECAKERG